MSRRCCITRFFLVLGTLFLPLQLVVSQSVLREFWLDISGSDVASLTSHPDFPGNPSGKTFPTAMEGPVNWAENYGTRMRAYVVPPETGNYVFWISGDDECQLYLSEDESPAAKSLVASVPGWTNYRVWDDYAEQQSDPISLESGRRYYIEALHKEGGGGDSVSVGWQLPNGELERPIPGDRLETFQISDDPPTIVTQPASQTVTEGESVEFRVAATGAEPFEYQWQRDGFDLDGEFDSRLILTEVGLEDDGAAFRCRVSNPRGTEFSEDAVLTVVSETDPPVLVRRIPPSGTTVNQLSQVEVMFSEAVTGVDAEDLLVLGVPSLEVTGFGAGPYYFEFAAPAPGEVDISWRIDHGITDLAGHPNAFDGSDDWQVHVDPEASLPAVVINEILASNQSGGAGLLGPDTDWIELKNLSGEAVSLDGWALTDDPDQPGQWVFPPVVLEAGARLVLLASGLDMVEGDELHTNFKLRADGEYLGLYSPESPRRVVDELDPGFPEQRPDVSYGRLDSGEWAYFAAPSPGEENTASPLMGLLERPSFSVGHGFFDGPFTLYLTHSDPEAEIRFTLDGSTPTATHGTPVQGPISIEQTSVIRAAAFREGFLSSAVVTRSYFVGEDESIRSLPVLSLVTDEDNLWGSTGIMETDPRNTVKRGIAWERPTSAEWIPASGKSGFQVNCGIRIQGGDYVRARYAPYGGLPFSKYSFRLYFRGDYGVGSLEYPLIPRTSVREFEVISLRAGMNDHTNPFIVDEMVRRLSADMGMVAAEGTLANLFLNGDYQGYYNPTERIDDDFLTSYLGGDGNWDVIAQFGEIREGDNVEWNRLRNAILNYDLSDPRNYQRVVEMADIDNFIDYYLLNIYCDTGDWPHNNWRMARKRTPDSKWIFIVWDAEWALGNNDSGVTDNTITTNLARDTEVAQFFQALRNNEDFRLRFADRFQKHCYHGGALDFDNLITRYEELRDAMRGVLPRMERSIRFTWIPNRRQNMIPHLRAAGLYAADNLPVFNQHGGPVTSGFPLEISSPQGTIYYTLDGTDPRRASVDSVQSLVFVTEAASKKVLVPTEPQDPLSWTGSQEPFDDSAWQETGGGIGYDLNPGYKDYFSLDLEEEMYSAQNSVYVRIPFHVEAETLEQVNQLHLGVRFDDGFIAYLNGVRVAAANAPEAPTWDDGATAQNPDTEATAFQDFDLSSHIPLLTEGPNLLALHGLNVSQASSDFLLSAQLLGDLESGGPIAPSARQYSEPIPLSSSLKVMARTYHEGEWSALTAAEFQVNSLGLPLRFTEIMYHPVGGELYEFVELTNFGPAPVDLSGMYMDGIKYRFQTGATLAGGGSVLLISNDDPEAFARRYPDVKWLGEFAGTLANGGERLTLFHPDGRVVTSVKYGDSGGWPAEADGSGPSLEWNDTTGNPDDPSLWITRQPGGGTPGALPPITAETSVQINEVMALNTGSVPHEDTLPDWIEIWNPTATPVELAGWGLSDDNANPARFVFPAPTRLNPGEFLVVWCDESTSTPGLHSGFSLKQEGETIYLTDPTGRRVDVLDYGRQLADRSLGRLEGQWQLTDPTPGAANQSAPTAPLSALVLNEWLISPSTGEDGWIELFNTSPDLPVALKDIYVSNGKFLQQLQEHAFLDAGEFLLLVADGKIDVNHLEFTLVPQRAEITLHDPLGITIDEVTYVLTTTGVSRGRLPDGGDEITDFGSSPSPGFSNVPIEYQGPRFNEIMAANRGIVHDSADGIAAWIELVNPGELDWNLAGFGLGTGDGNSPDWRAPANLILPAHEFLILWCDPNRPVSTTAEGDINTGLNLSDQSEILRWFDASGRIMDEVTYGFQLPDQSIGSSGALWVLLEEPTPGAANAPPATLGSKLSLRINEWLADITDGDDFIELYNPEASPVELSRLYLTDDPSITGKEKFQIGPASYIAPHGWIRWLADGEIDKGAHHTNFSLDRQGEYLRLYTPTKSIIDDIAFGWQETGASEGRWPDGSATIARLYPTPAAANATEPGAADSDEDGMPDLWELDHFLNPFSPDDAALDADHDGQSNLEEFHAKTNPNDPGDVFAVRLKFFTDAGWALEFTAKPGLTYAVESTPVLPASLWTKIATTTPATDEHLEKISLPAIPAENNGFFRIVIH